MIMKNENSLTLESYRYCRMLEEGSFRGRTADFVFMFIFGGAIMTVSFMNHTSNSWNIAQKRAYELVRDNVSDNLNMFD